MLLAEALTSAFTMQALLFVVLIGQAITIWMGIMGRSQKREIHPQPLKVEGITQFALKEQFEQHAAEDLRAHENLFAKMGGMERGIRAEIKVDIEKLYVEVNRLREGQASLNTMTHAQDRKIEQMDSKLDDIKTFLVENQR